MSAGYARAAYAMSGRLLATYGVADSTTNYLSSAIDFMNTSCGECCGSESMGEVTLLKVEDDHAAPKSI